MPPADGTQEFAKDHAGAPTVTFGRTDFWSLVSVAVFGALTLHLTRVEGMRLTVGLMRRVRLGILNFLPLYAPFSWTDHQHSLAWL